MLTEIRARFAQMRTLPTTKWLQILVHPVKLKLNNIITFYYLIMNSSLPHV
jgi:hypothetical protein